MNLSSIKLGKKPRRIDPRTRLLARYLDVAALPSAPAAVDWTPKLGPLGVMLNDSLGDCTIAAAGHLVQTWTGNADPSPTVVPDSAVLAAYEGACGYNPANPGTDQGGVELDVLNYWRATGIGGHKIAAYAQVAPADRTEVEQAIALFGGIYVGVGLPTSAQGQVGGLWDITPSTPKDFDTWGGHAIPIVGYDATGLTCITWGALQRMTWAWFAAYCDEAYAAVSTDWISPSGLSPSAFNLAQLQSDIAALSSS